MTEAGAAALEAVEDSPEGVVGFPEVTDQHFPVDQAAQVAQAPTLSMEQTSPMLTVPSPVKRWIHSALKANPFCFNAADTPQGGEGAEMAEATPVIMEEETKDVPLVLSILPLTSAMSLTTLPLTLRPTPSLAMARLLAEEEEVVAEDAVPDGHRRLERSGGAF